MRGNSQKAGVLLLQKRKSILAVILSALLTLSALTVSLAPAVSAAAAQKSAETEARAVLDKVGWNFKSAYNWCVKNLKYTKHVPSDNANYGIEKFACYGFENKKGNCYCFSACLYEMGKLLNENIHVVHGTVPYRTGGSGPHSWNEVIRNGKTYVCDAEFEQESIQKKRSYTNGYMFTYGTKGTWKYSNIKRVN